MERLAIRLCIPVWGDSHFSAMTELALPSWLAPGNIPALAAAHDLRMVFLSRQSDIAGLQQDERLASLRALVPIEGIAIDDLITSGLYAVTLTLAFARGIRVAQATTADPVVAFINSDMILADGSLASLGRVVGGGARVVLAHSLRSVAEASDGALRRLKRQGVLRVPPRELVQLALDNLHPTVTASIVDQPVLHSRQPVQFFWRAGPGTLLARSLQLFPLAVRPTVPLERADSYCDYGMFERLAPGSTVHVMDDSDAYFALESEPQRHEAAFLSPGEAKLDAIRDAIATWSTQEQRAQARHRIAIHAEPLGAEFAAAEQASAAFMQALLAPMGTPRDGPGHPYWVGGLDAWRQLRRDQGERDWPIELGSEADLAEIGSDLGAPVTKAGWLAQAVRRTGRALLRGGGRPRRWHAHYAVAMAAYALREEVAAGGGATVRDDGFLKQFGWPPLEGSNPSRTVAVTEVGNLPGLARHLKEIQLPPGGHLHLLLHGLGHDPQQMIGLSRQVAMVDRGYRILRAQPFGDRFTHWSDDRLRSAAAYWWRGGVVHRLQCVLMVADTLAVLYLRNLRPSALQPEWRQATGLRLDLIKRPMAQSESADLYDRDMK